MAFTELELKRFEKPMALFMKKRRPSVRIRDMLDYVFKIGGQSIELYEVRPYYRDKSIKTEQPVFRATYVRSRKIWKLYWMRGSLKWELYEPAWKFRSLDKLLDEVDADKHYCFFG